MNPWRCSGLLAAAVVLIALCLSIPLRPANAGEWESSEVLLAKAVRYEHEADSLGSGSMRRQWLINAAEDYLQAAIPSNKSPFDSPLRSEPGPSWKRYRDLADSLLASDSLSASGVREAFLLLTPNLLSRLSDLHYWPIAIYGSKYLEPMLTARARATTPQERLIADAAIAECAKTWNWSMTCERLRVAHAIADSLPMVRGCRVDLTLLKIAEDGVAGELVDLQQQVQKALDMVAEQAGDYPSDRTLMDPRKLWTLVAPFMPRAMTSVDPRACRDPEREQSGVERLLSVPGIRPYHVNRWHPPGGSRVAYIEFTRVMR